MYYIAFFPISQPLSRKNFTKGGGILKTVGIVCEYNPLHLGHKKQIDQIREAFGSDTAIVCAMSGNYVQRGHPAIVDKTLRAKAAVLSGADLVLEMPVTASLASAEGFAAGGVRILSQVCDTLCFGAETAGGDSLMQTARVLLSPDFMPLLRRELDNGKSFPAARQAALAQMNLSADILSRPNDILAVEYCKAILAQNTAMDIFPIRREGSYHAEEPDPENPSATALRSMMPRGQDWKPYLPAESSDTFINAPLHTLEAGQRAILARLRTMTDAEFEALPYGSEGLWRKLMHASRSCATLDGIIAATKSKRYTRTRLDRMVMCAFLGITETLMNTAIPYTRVLAFNDKGRSILKEAKKTGTFLNAGEASNHPHWELEKHCGALYGLFRLDGLDPPDMEEKRRIYYHSLVTTDL